VRLAQWLVAAVLVVFVGRLLQFQGLEAPAFANAAEKQRLRTVTLAAARGDLLDRDGQVLATTVDARAIYADPRDVTDARTTAALLAPLLQVDQKELLSRLTRQHTAFVYLARGIAPDQANQVMAAVSAAKLGGIGALPERKRVYPESEVAANLTGFVSRDGKGLAGLEYGLDDVLSGTDGWEKLEIGRNGQQIPLGASAIREPRAGTTVSLTIDRDIQWMAQQAIVDQVRKTGAKSGTVIVMDPRSGELLAVATAPSFDPADTSTATPEDLQNRAVSDVYEPGSTNKVITAAAALELGIANVNTPVTVPPTLKLAGHTFHDAEKHGTEHLTFAGVLAKSSNIGTILLSKQVGKERLYGFLKSFGFGQKSGSGLPGEERGILPDVEGWSGTQQYTIPFGQGLSVTALQVASVYATVANGGVRVTPHVIRGTVTDGKLKPAPRATSRRVVSAKTAATLRTMLEAVTSDQGTAPAARITGYRVAGKTGTSQRVDSSCGCYRGYTSSFVGFAPADDPQLLVEVVLQAPVRGHFGGTTAAPVFHDVMAFALQSRQIVPTLTRPPVLRLTYDVRR
jgi:cell division protein FtsI (penicillin-binding protein 3)